MSDQGFVSLNSISHINLPTMLAEEPFAVETSELKLTTLTLGRSLIKLKACLPRQVTFAPLSNMPIICFPFILTFKKRRLSSPFSKTLSEIFLYIFFFSLNFERKLSLGICLKLNKELGLILNTKSELLLTAKHFEPLGSSTKTGVIKVDESSPKQSRPDSGFPSAYVWDSLWQQILGCRKCNKKFSLVLLYNLHERVKDHHNYNTLVFLV